MISTHNTIEADIYLKPDKNQLWLKKKKNFKKFIFTV